MRARGITIDARIIGSGYFSRVFVDPANPGIAYVELTPGADLVHGRAGAVRT